jgi:hypothetical protein
MPVLDHHARRTLAVERGIDVGAERMKGLEVIDEQPHLPVVFAGQLAREPPADADVAEIVDDRAENIARDVGGWSAGSTLAWPEAAGNCSDEDGMGNRAAMNR